MKLKKALTGIVCHCNVFRVKFYVTDPSRLQEEYTRYHVYLQVGGAGKDENYNTKLTLRLLLLLLQLFAGETRLGHRPFGRPHLHGVLAGFLCGSVDPWGS